MSKVFKLLSVLGVLLFLVVAPLGLAQARQVDRAVVPIVEQGMDGLIAVTQAQTDTTPTTEPTTEATVEATTEATVEAPAEATTEPALDATQPVTGTETTTDQQQPAVATATPQVTTLPQTGGELSPMLAMLLLALGALFLVGGLTLALARRTR
jgi:hypothetical protein